MLIVAGATGYGVWPDNTVGGLRRCLEAPVDGVEIDAVMTADGHVVAHHDYRLSRRQTRLGGAWLTEPGPVIKDISLSDRRRYDVGRTRPGAENPRYPHRGHLDGEAVPTLDELFAALVAAEGPRRWFYIEIKTDPTDPALSPDFDAITRKVVAAIEAHGYQDRAKIIAFDWRVLRLAAATNPDIATAHLTVPADSPWAEAFRPADRPSPWLDGCDPRHHGGSDLAAIKAHGGMEWSPYWTDVTPERVEEARSLGLKVGPWGLSKPADIAAMKALGVWSATVSGPDWG
ncbi:MAG TPA: glycerophosphodiester phosphodiesterase family protein [Caulobacteraceae bacterium]|nr:glycerophosphodiester phosphodiesterase family protein [Caulobacteraceae bacterium]